MTPVSWVVGLIFLPTQILKIGLGRRIEVQNPDILRNSSFLEAEISRPVSVCEIQENLVYKAMCTLLWHLVYQPNAPNSSDVLYTTSFHDFDNSCGKFEARNNKMYDHVYFSLSLVSKVNICWWTLFPEILSQSSQSINSSTSQWSVCSLFFVFDLFVCLLPLYAKNRTQILLETCLPFRPASTS